MGREWRGLAVVDDDGDAAIGVEAEEPLFLLLVGHDVDEGGGPGGSVEVVELFEEDLDGLAVGGVHGDEVKALAWCVVVLVGFPASIVNSEGGVNE